MQFRYIIVALRIFLTGREFSRFKKNYIKTTNKPKNNLRLEVIWKFLIMEDAGGSGGFIWQGKGGNLFYPTPTLHESRPGYKIRNFFEHTQKEDRS